MGLNYSFQLITPKKNLEELFSNLPKVASHRSHDELKALLAGDRQEPHRSIRASFRFQVDKRLEYHLSSLYCLGHKGIDSNGGIELGGIGVSVWSGHEFAIVDLRAPTSTISHIFIESPSVIETFWSVAKASGASALVIDCEGSRLLVENARGFWLHELTDEDDEIYFDYDVDRFANEVLDRIHSGLRGVALPTDAEIVERQLLEDRQYIANMGPESLTEKCRRDGCQRGRVSLSVLCAIHHFEMLLGRPYTAEEY